jgi:hypothetical protein
VQVRDFDYLTSLWHSDVEHMNLNDSIKTYGNSLKNALDLEIADLDADASKFFKAVHLNQYRSGIGFLEKE